MHSPCRVSGVQIQPTTGTSGSLAVWIDELDNIKQLTTCSCPGGGMGTRDSLAANSFTLSSDNLLALSCASKLQKCTEENDLRNDNTHIRAVLKTYWPLPRQTVLQSIVIRMLGYDTDGKSSVELSGPGGRPVSILIEHWPFLRGQKWQIHCVSIESFTGRSVIAKAFNTVLFCTAL